MPDFSWTGVQRSGYEIIFHSNIRNAGAYRWNFGDGLFSSDSAPHHSYAGSATYTVTLFVNNDSEKLASKTITIDVPYDFSITGVPAAGNLLTFTSNAPTGSSFLWNFGDGSTSTDEIPVHSFGANGTYHVSLEVNNDGHTLQKSLNLFSEGIYLGLIPTGTKSWRHVLSWSGTHSYPPDTLGDTTMPITFVPPSSILIGSDTMSYLMSMASDSVLVFNVDPPSDYVLVYDVYFNRYTLSLTFQKIYFRGSTTPTSYDTYYSP